MSINAPKETILEDANTKIPGHLPSNANNISIAKQPKQPTAQTQTDESVPVEDVSRETPVEDPIRKEKEFKLFKEVENLKNDVINQRISKEEYDRRLISLKNKKDNFSAIYESGFNDVSKKLKQLVDVTDPDITQDDFFDKLHKNNLNVTHILKYKDMSDDDILEEQGFIKGTPEFETAKNDQYKKGDAFFKSSYELAQQFKNPISKADYANMSREQKMEYMQEQAFYSKIDRQGKFSEIDWNKPLISFSSVFDKYIEDKKSRNYLFNNLKPIVPGMGNLSDESKKAILKGFKGVLEPVDEFTSPAAGVVGIGFGAIGASYPLISKIIGVGMSGSFIFDGGNQVMDGLDMVADGDSGEGANMIGQGVSNTVLGALGMKFLSKGLVADIKKNPNMATLMDFNKWQKSGIIERTKKLAEVGAIGDVKSVNKKVLAELKKGKTKKQIQEEEINTQEITAAFRNLYNEYVDAGGKTKVGFLEHVNKQFTEGGFDPSTKNTVLRLLGANWNNFKGQVISAQAGVGDPKQTGTAGKDLKPNYSGNINLDLFPPEQRGIWRTVGKSLQNWRNLRKKDKQYGWDATDKLASSKEVVREAVAKLSRYIKNEGYEKNPQNFEMLNEHEFRALNHIMSTLAEEVLRNPKRAKELAPILENVYAFNTASSSAQGRILNINKMKTDRELNKRFHKEMAQYDEFSNIIDMMKKGDSPPSMLSKFIEWQRNMRLASLSSIVRSGIGNLSHFAMNAPESIMSSMYERILVDATRKVPLKKAFRERRLIGVYEGYGKFFEAYGNKRLWKNVWGMLKEDKSVLMKDPFFTRERFSVSGNIGKGWSFITERAPWFDAGKMARFPQRAQAAIDIAIRIPAEDMFIRRMAVNEAMNAGLNPGTQRYNNFIKRFEKSPTKQQLKKVKDSAEYLTFQQEMGSLMKSFNAYRTGEGGQLWQILIPFANTPVNLMKASLERTPVGFLQGFINFGEKGIKNKFTKSHFGKGYKTGHWGDFSDKMSRATTIPSLAYLVYEMTDIGANFRYEGNWNDKTAEEIKFLQDQGFIPNSIRVMNEDGTWDNYSTLGYEPINTVLKYYQEAAKGKELGDSDISAYTTAMLTIAMDFQENPILSGVKDITDLFSGDTHFISWAVKNIRSTTLPNFMSQYHSIIDPVNYWNQVKKRPGITGNFRNLTDIKEWRRAFEKEFMGLADVDGEFNEAYEKAKADWSKSPDKEYEVPSMFLDKHLDPESNYPRLTLFGKPSAKPDPKGGIFAFRHTKGGEDKIETFLYDELERLGFQNLSWRKRIKGDIELTRVQQYMTEAIKGELFRKNIEDIMTNESWTKKFVEGEMYYDEGEIKQRPGTWEPIPAKDLTMHQVQQIEKTIESINLLESFYHTQDETLFQKEYPQGFGVHTTPGGGKIPTREEEVEQATKKFRSK